MITDTAVKNIQQQTIEKAAFFLAMKTWLERHHFKKASRAAEEQYKSCLEQARLVTGILEEDDEWGLQKRIAQLARHKLHQNV